MHFLLGILLNPLSSSFFLADIGAQGSRPKDSVLRPKEFLISAPRAPQRFFAAPQERPEGFFAYPKATKGFSEKIIKQILISLGRQGWGSPILWDGVLW